MCGEIFERSPIEANQCFLYNRFHFSVTTFHIHHHSHRHAPGNPLAGRFGRVANRRHITRFTLAYQQCCGITERITIVGIEIGRIGTTAFVTEEVELRSEFTHEFPFGFHFGQTTSNHLAQQFFGFDKRYLNISVGVAVERELTGDTFGQAGIDSRIFGRKVFDDIIDLFRFLNHCEFRTVRSQIVVQLGDKTLHGRDKFNKSFGNQHRSEVVTFGGTGSHDFGDIIYYIVESHLLGLDFLRNQTNIGLSLQSAFQSDMRSRTSHQLDKVPIFLSRVTVSLYVTDYFGIYFTSRIETERRLYHFVLQVSIDSFRATDYLNSGSNLFIIFGEYASVGIGIVATDNNDSFDSQLFNNFETTVELILRFQFGTSRTDNVESARIAVVIDNIGRKFHIFMFDQSAGA